MQLTCSYLRIGSRHVDLKSRTKAVPMSGLEGHQTTQKNKESLVLVRPRPEAKDDEVAIEEK